MAIAANDSLSAGILTWRYMYNTTFANIQPFPKLGVYHGSEGMESFYFSNLLHLCSRPVFGFPIFLGARAIPFHILLAPPL
jgi:hypothetical protein